MFQSQRSQSLSEPSLPSRSRRIPRSGKGLRALVLGAVFALAGLLPASVSAQAGQTLVDVNAKVSFLDDYDPGVGGGLGLVYGLSDLLDGSLNFSYLNYAGDVEDANEIDVNLGLHWAPFYGAFKPKLGAHIGLARFEDENFLDIGPELQLVFRVSDMLYGYSALIPSFYIGEENEYATKVGVGLQYILR